MHALPQFPSTAVSRSLPTRRFARWSPAVALALFGAVLLSGLAGPARAGFMSSSAECTGAQQITFSWNWYEFDGYITARPEWVGYDVLRRPINACTPYERINAEIVPRTVGESHARALVDAPPSTGETFEYKAIPVDANREPVIMLMPDCEPPCSRPAWASCPANSAPLVVGLVVDWGWTLAVQPCPNSCYWHYYLANGAIEQELRDQGRVGTIVALYGTGFCCGIEGAAMDPTSWASGECVPTAARRSTWGELKTIYRQR